MSKKREQSVQPPWEAWKLDKTFFRTLAQYNASHPETTLDCVLDGIRTGLENHQPLFNLIPDAPFPARGLVGALAHLIKLGVVSLLSRDATAIILSEVQTVHRAQASVRDFSEQVVAWVIDVKAAFESTVSGHFSWTTWKNLRKMRDLIDEICRWANARLEDKRWTRIGNGMMISTEIAEFNMRINEAKSLFTDLTLINLSGGMDAILSGLWLLLQRQDSITKEIEKIKDKQREQFVSRSYLCCRKDTNIALKSYIIDGIEMQKQTEARRLFLSQNLSPRVVTNPMYDQQGKLPCDEDTRTQVLEDIRNWVNDISPESPNFLWLTGDPGCGKSAITASIARECKDRNILWGQYFINRNNIETTDPNSYFPSIARQFADHSNDVEVSIHDCLKRKPSLMDRISPEQAAALFVDAIGVASKIYPDRPVVVVIDGLDETDKAHLKDTAMIFACLFQRLSLHGNAKVLLSSRTEDDIRNPFARYIDDQHVKHVHLDTASQSSIDDVSAFLRRKIARIVEDNDLNWADWPGERRIEILTRRASGLFIWAVTVAKFIQEQIDIMGTECLNDVLDMLDADTLGDINTLYSIILRETYKNTTSNWEFEKFRRIVGAIVDLCEPLCLADLATLLNLKQRPSSSPVDIIKFVQRLRTVLVAGTGAINSETIPRLHKSFYEFIISQQADSRFRINLEITNGELAICCLTQFQGARTMTSCPWVASTLPTSFRYAFRFWSIHLHKSAGGTAAGIMIANNLSLTRDDCHEVLRNIGNECNFDPVHITFSPNQSRILIASGKHRSAWDAINGFEFKDTHTILQGHKDFVSSVSFSPDSRLLVSGSADKTAIVWDVQSSHMVTSLKGHSRELNSVMYSPDGRYIASASADFTTRVWDALTYFPTAAPRRHARPVRSLAFSPDGTQIVSGSDDHHVRFWGWKDDHCVTMTPAHHRPVTSVTISPDGKIVASSSDDSTVRLWNAELRRPLGPPLEFSRVFGLQFSPKGTYLVAVDAETGNAVFLWKPDTVNSNKPEIALRGHDLVPPVARICSITFSPDESSLVLGCSDHTIRIVDLLSVNHRSLCYVGHSGWVMTVAVSADGKYIASGSVDNNVHVWDMPVLRETHTRDDRPKTHTNFSSDGTFVISASSNKGTRLWNSKNNTFRDIPLPVTSSKGPCVKYVCFSSDRRRIAGACSEADETFQLWDVETCALVASASKGVASQNSDITSLSFTADSRYLIATYTGAPPDVWEEKDGALIHVDATERMGSFAEAEPLAFFDTQSHAPFNLGGALWFPDAAVSGLWVFLDGCIVRAHENGSMTVLSRKN
ncbi:hypothetical protein H0H87_002337 [Tephrocybe sp. NHM501043]|nr:hypothetical protein H0H87_002337 [Tephrocybe sp. NHM501043]